MSSFPWARLHGASVHFPIALVCSAFVFDLAAVIWWSRPLGRHLSVAGAGAMLLGAVGSVAAVISGLILTKGEIWGSGDLGWHHRFVWPAFGLIVGAATWRTAMRENLSRRSCAGYLGIVLVTVGLIGGAGYFGGELLQGVP